MNKLIILSLTIIIVSLNLVTSDPLKSLLTDNEVHNCPDDHEDCNIIIPCTCSIYMGEHCGIRKNQVGPAGPKFLVLRGRECKTNILYTCTKANKIAEETAYCPKYCNCRDNEYGRDICLTRMQNQTLIN
ncbi:uncharacterized protein LOC128965129 [Oppia nitens]|uniref:uncharacterized protein LOC128965129 n=1 Tax=Oppia nitens TaxID=1686743 RepID=UPI0023DA84C5|nr:uncharacterized protein LOC128965129 [Oppia nitens]